MKSSPKYYLFFCFGILAYFVICFYLIFFKSTTKSSKPTPLTIKTEVVGATILNDQSILELPFDAFVYYIVKNKINDRRFIDKFSYQVNKGDVDLYKTAQMLDGDWGIFTGALQKYILTKNRPSTEVILNYEVAKDFVLLLPNVLETKAALDIFFESANSNYAFVHIGKMTQLVNNSNVPYALKKLWISKVYQIFPKEFTDVSINWDNGLDWEAKCLAQPAPISDNIVELGRTDWQKWRWKLDRKLRYYVTSSEYRNKKLWAYPDATSLPSL